MYLHKSDGAREEFETFLFYAISRYHCIETIIKNCNEFRFHEMKKEYSFFINLEMTEDEIRENNIDLSSIEARLNKLLQIYRIMGSPRFSPKLYFPYEQKDADIIVNITLNKNINIDPKLESDHCPTHITLKNNVLTGATYHILNTDIGNDRIGYCVGKILMSFYDILGLFLADKNLSKTDRAIYLGLAAEYYRWLAINNNYPKNKNELTKSINDYTSFIYSEFNIEAS